MYILVCTYVVILTSYNIMYVERASEIFVLSVYHRLYMLIGLQALVRMRDDVCAVYSSDHKMYIYPQRRVGYRLIHQLRMRAGCVVPNVRHLDGRIDSNRTVAVARPASTRHWSTTRAKTKCGFMFYRDTSYCIVLQQCTASCYSVPYVSSTLYRPSKSFANVSYIIIQFYYDRPIKYCYVLRVGNNNNKLITFCPS